MDDTISIDSVTPLAREWGRLDRYEVTHARRDGTRQTVLREVYDHGSAAAVLIISVNAANAFVSERVQQTLDLLLTTPMSARQIVEEKARAMRRFLYVAAAPLMTLF